MQHWLNCASDNSANCWNSRNESLLSPCAARLPCATHFDSQRDGRRSSTAESVFKRLIWFYNLCG